MKQSSLYSHVLEGYGTVRQDERPADVVLSEYLRARKYLGATDRRFISETIYGLMRRDLALEHYAENALAEVNLPKRFLFPSMLFFFLIEQKTVDVQALSELVELSPEKFARLQAVFESERHDASLAERYSFPEWVVKKLQSEFSEENLARLLDSLNHSAPLTLRVNTLLSNRDALKQSLSTIQIKTTNGSLSPDALIVEGRKPIFQSKSFKDGHCEVQDEGSQVISVLLNPKPKSVVLDACAGGGGKTLHLASLMQNKGKVYAFEKFPKRFGNIRERIRRSGLQNIMLLDTPEKFSRFTSDFTGKLDAVLIDAPCTGSGTLRRNPDLKRRLTEEFLNEVTVLQTEILDTYASFVKPGGKLLYATCSIFRDENEMQVEAFLKSHSEFSLTSVAAAAQSITSTADLTGLKERLKNEPYLKLYPHTDNTDGFFAAVMTRA
jgi:16S rRNA (cytosine967-C5)-methyltransferase